MAKMHSYRCVLKVKCVAYLNMLDTVAVYGDGLWLNFLQI